MRSVHTQKFTLFYISFIKSFFSCFVIFCFFLYRCSPNSYTHRPTRKKNKAPFCWLKGLAFSWVRIKFPKYSHIILLLIINIISRNYKFCINWIELVTVRNLGMRYRLPQRVGYCMKNILNFIYLRWIFYSMYVYLCNIQFVSIYDYI